MFKKQAPAQRSNVTVDDRRAVLVIAQARKPKEVAEVAHEQFIRNALKDRLNWPRREPAPQAVLDAAKQMGAVLKQRDLERSAAVAKARAEQEANDAAVAQGIADNV